MTDHHVTGPDYGTGQKKLGMYIWGVIGCIILTVVAFGAVMIGTLSKLQVLAIIFIAAVIQFLVQVVCFLRLTTQSPQGKMNLMAFIFTIVILVCIVGGSLWILWNLNYYTQ